MNAVFMAVWFVTGACAGWRLTLRLVSPDISKVRETADFWKCEATKARAEAQRVVQEAASYAAGCRQGREDVISLVPFLLSSRAPVSAGDNPADADDHLRP
jgi:hypothetical protein